jgi:hypothetical protein
MNLQPPDAPEDTRTDYEIGLDEGRTEQATEIAELKAKLAELREDYRKMVANYQTLIIDLAPYLAPDQIHMVGSRTGNWFFAMEDGKYLVRYDPRDSEAGLWENTKPTPPFTPITADDVTDEMLSQVQKANVESFSAYNEKALFATVVNT